LKTSFLGSAILGCALSVSMVSAVSAQEASAPAKPAMGMNMGSGMEMDKPMSRMHENMSAAQQQMDKFRGTTDPKQRRKLMREHMQTLQDSMKMMHSMEGPMTMGGAQESGMQTPPGKPMASAEMKKHHDMMQGHMQMMQMLLEQMVQQDQMMMDSITAR
jgi:hypothetical protein